MQQFAPHKLRELREERGLSQTELAYSIRRAFATYRLYEQGKYAPSAKLLPAIADALGCRVEDLFEEVETGV